MMDGKFASGRSSVIVFQGWRLLRRGLKRFGCVFMKGASLRWHCGCLGGVDIRGWFDGWLCVLVAFVASVC